jgi:hypothetical protein
MRKCDNNSKHKKMLGGGRRGVNRRKSKAAAVGGIGEQCTSARWSVYESDVLGGKTELHSLYLAVVETSSFAKRKLQDGGRGGGGGGMK